MGSSLQSALMVALVVVEIALVGLAYGVATHHVLVRPVRWLSRGLAVAGLLVGMAMGLGAVEELARTDYPLVLPGKPFGTYTQPTDAMLLAMVIGSVMMVPAALLAFRHSRPAGLLFVVAGVWNLLGSLQQYQDATMPAGNATFGVVVIGLPGLVVGVLLLAMWRAEHTVTYQAPTASAALEIS